MGYRIAFEWDKECEKELIEKGFKKREVYIKYDSKGPTDIDNEAGNAEFFAMKNKPFQFITTSWWGACVD